MKKLPVILALILISAGSGFGQSLKPNPFTTNATPARVGRTLIVDTTYGVDASAIQNSLALTYKTLAAAKTAAVAGDLIHVRPGTYNERNLLKNGVNWYFDQGSVVAYTGSAAGGVFDDSANGANGPVVCTIAGSGVFTSSGTHPSADVGTFVIGNAGSTMVVLAKSISNTSASGANRSALLLTSGTVYLHVATRIDSTVYDGIVQAGGTLYVDCDTLAGDQGSEAAFEGPGSGTAHIRARSILGYLEVTDETSGLTLYNPVITSQDATDSIIGAATVKIVGSLSVNNPINSTITLSTVGTQRYVGDGSLLTNINTILRTNGTGYGTTFYGPITNRSPGNLITHHINDGVGAIAERGKWSDKVGGQGWDFYALGDDFTVSNRWMGLTRTGSVPSVSAIVFDAPIFGNGANLSVLPSDYYASTYVNVTGDTMTGQLINSLNGAASTPPLTLTGTWFTGGSATTTKPHLLIEPTGATSTGWSTAGTGLGINAASGFTGNHIDMQLNGAARFKVAAAGTVTLVTGSSGAPSLQIGDSSYGLSSANNGLYLHGLGGTAWFRAGVAFALGSTTPLGWSSSAEPSSQDMFIIRDAAATLQQGADSATPIAQTFKGADARAGTDTDVGGGSLTIGGGRNTGTGNGGSLNFATAGPRATGTAAGVYSNQLVIASSGVATFAGNIISSAGVFHGNGSGLSNVIIGTDFKDFASNGNIGSGETSIQDSSDFQGKLTADGWLYAYHVAGTFVNSTSTKRLRLYLNSVLIFDTGAITVTGATSWDIDCWVIRDSSTTARCTTKLNLSGASTGAYATQTDVTGLTYSGTPFGLVLTGTSAGAGVADNDVIAKMAYGEVKR